MTSSLVNTLLLTNNYAICFLQKLPLVLNSIEIFFSQEMWKFSKNVECTWPSCAALSSHTFANVLNTQIMILLFQRNEDLNSRAIVFFCSFSLNGIKGFSESFWKWNVYSFLQKWKFKFNVLIFDIEPFTDIQSCSMYIDTCSVYINKSNTLRLKKREKMQWQSILAYLCSI